MTEKTDDKEPTKPAPIAKPEPKPAPSQNANIIEAWYQKHFLNAGLDTRSYNIVLAAKDDLTTIFK
jgi:hypothetical protein